LDLFEPDQTQFSSRFVPPKGSSEPLLYVIAEAPGFNEDQQQLPLVGKAGKLLDDAIRVAGIDASKIRFHNAVPYRPIQKDGWKTNNRTPSDDEIHFYKIFVQRDIRKTKPKALLLIGKSAMMAFGINVSPTIGRTQEFEWETIPTIVSWHPSYVLRNGGETSRQFTELVSDITKAWRIPKGGVLNSSKFEIVDILR
jgi:uracil-DNA glycosylase family 4